MSRKLAAALLVSVVVLPKALSLGLGSTTFLSDNPLQTTEGSEVVFEWSYTFKKPRTQAKFHHVTFGKWHDHLIEEYLITVLVSDESVILEPTMEQKRPHYIRRFSWIGNLTQSRVAFRISNVTLSDTGNYGCRLDIDGTEELVSRAASLKVEPRSSFKGSPPPQTPVLRHGLVQLTWEYQLNPIDKAAFTSLVWGRYNTSGSFVPLYNVSSSRTQATKDPRYARRISIQTCKYVSRCSFLLTKVDWQDGGQYEARLVNDKGEALLTSSTELVVQEKPKFTRYVSGNKTITENEQLVLTCKAEGVPTPSIQWKRNGRLIQDNAGTSYVVDKVQLRDAGRYACVARNAAGNISSPEISINVEHAEQSFDPDLQFEMDAKEAEAEKKTSTRHNNIFVISVIALAVAVVIFSTVMCLIFQRHRTRGVKEFPVEENICSKRTGTESGADGEFPRDRLVIDRVVGTGAFGVVCRGYAFDLPGLSGWKTVAIKTVPENACGDIEKQDLLSELKLLKTLKAHPHVIKLLGYIISSHSPMVIVEYVPYGDLLGYLKKSRGAHDNYYNVPGFQVPTSLTSRQLLRFAWQIADGMDFLSSMKIVHRDLAARNVLVGEGGKCKITDFGMARSVDSQEIYFRSTAGRIPVKWTAIEAITGRHEYSTQSDVWSFGVVLYEIFTIGGEPFPGICVQKIPRLLKEGKRMAKPRHVDDELYSIMMDCWKPEPPDRPSFASLRAHVKALEDQNGSYVNVQECILQYEAERG